MCIRDRVCAGSRWGSLRLPSGMRTYASDQLVNIIQHPAGRPKEVALQDNRIVKGDADAKLFGLGLTAAVILVAYDVFAEMCIRDRNQSK